MDLLSGSLGGTPADRLFFMPNFAPFEQQEIF
jgi:hypothetical protein